MLLWLNVWGVAAEGNSASRCAKQGYDLRKSERSVVLSLVFSLTLSPIFLHSSRLLDFYHTRFADALPISPETSTDFLHVHPTAVDQLNYKCSEDERKPYHGR